MVDSPQNSASKGRRGSAVAQNDHISDPRFANIQTDPRFRLPSKKSTHVQIDKRFERMLRDESFSSRAKVDRYGRRLPNGAGKKELEKYYKIDDDEDKVEEDREVQLELTRGNAEDEAEVSSSAEESSSEESDIDESEEDELFGLLDAQGADEADVPLGEVTSRLAVVNLDWDNIRAADLMAVFSSFVSSAGQIKQISIYPSEFGKERIEIEEMKGPPKEIFAQAKKDVSLDERKPDSEDSDDEASVAEEDDEKIKKSLLQEGTDQEFNSAKLRRYQLERLRYYYAVLTCSSTLVAQNIYEAVDGTEYLNTANFFDLRFIPDDVDFSQDKPRDECTRIPDGYRPNDFVTDALQHSKVRLTWDADDATRKDVQRRAFAASRANIDENDLKAYLGSDSSEDEGGDDPEPIVVDATTITVPETEQQPPPKTAPPKPTSTLSKKEAERQRMRALLGLLSEPATTAKSKNSRLDKSALVGDMQITFSSGLTTSQPTGSVFTNSSHENEDREETTVEKYVRKEKERKARRKAKLKGSSTPAHPDAQQNGGKEGDEEKDLGFSDPFFTAADPSTTTKQTKAEPKEARRRKKAERAADEAAASAKRTELELLSMEDDADQADGETQV
ncbi:MAG: hypothetical protein Q9201_000906 [Fulgogasparrea decipioides]